MRTREQKRSLSAFTQTEAIKADSDAIKTDFGNMAHKLPLLIRNAGLAQALAFVESKIDPPKQKGIGYRRLIESLEGTLRELGILGQNEGLSSKARDASTGVSLYMLLTRETLSCLIWYKRFAESVLNISGNQADLEGAA